MQIKVISDGMPGGTRVVNAETGENLDGCYSVLWQHTAPGEMPVAMLECYCVPVELVTTVSGPVEITQSSDKFRRYTMQTQTSEPSPEPSNVPMTHDRPRSH